MAATMTAHSRHLPLACDAGALDVLGRGDPAWMQAARRAAWARFAQAPMPARTDEACRRLDLSQLDLTTFHPAAPSHESAPPSADLATARAQGVVVEDLSSALVSHAATLRPLLDAAPSDGTFAALHQALWNRGTFIRIPRNIRVEQSLRTMTTADGDGIGYFPHTLILVEPGARAVVLDESLADGEGANLHCSVVTILVQSGARLVYANLQGLNLQTHRFLWQRVRVERDGHCLTFNGEFGGQLSRVEVSAELLGPGARSELFGLVMGRGAQHSEVHTFQQHTAPHTSSDLLYKTILRDRARSTYQGLIRVTKQAQQTDAYQANRNLLLGHEAHAESMPKLEIEADDVRCTHGATVGHVDEELQFYLMSRGLQAAAADRMIVDGFIEELLTRLPEESLREQARQHVARVVA